MPLVSVADLKGLLLNSSTARLAWSSEHQNAPLLNGQFRTYAVTMYRNFGEYRLQTPKCLCNWDSPTDMSTLITMETMNPFLVLHDLQSASEYFLSVAICNYLDCGPSSSVINIQTPSPGMLLRNKSGQHFSMIPSYCFSDRYQRLDCTAASGG